MAKASGILYTSKGFRTNMRAYLGAVPLAITAPAAAAGLAYINAKTGFSYDKQMLRGVAPAAFLSLYREWKDRCNIFYTLEERALNKSTANRTYLAFGDRTWTYVQTYETALRYANYFKNRYALKPKDIVALNFMNSDYYVVLLHAFWALGVKPALINYNLTGEALSHCVQVAQSRVMLVDPEVAANVDDNVRAKLGDLRIDIVTPELLAEAGAEAPVRPPDDVRSGEQLHDMGMLIYTSGTTGLPKAAIVSWAKMVKASIFISRWLATKPTDVFYTVSTLQPSILTIAKSF
jgi:acyl-CoA synthetase (AMP-forming)/AMP-acid ligase II